MIRRELGIFLIVGSLTVVVDFLTYQALLEWAGLDAGLAKAFGFLAGTVFAYVANRYWTFGRKHHRSGSFWRFGLVYAITLAVNVLINSVVLQKMTGAFAAVQIAFLLATGVSAILNFIGMKLFVFRERGVKEHT